MMVKTGGNKVKNQITFQQIVLITDGYSNTGISPIEAAKVAADQGITVHVIGISEFSSKQIQGRKEIEEIAKFGGGYSQIVELEHVAKTVELFTKKTMNRTIQQVVQQQLKEILRNPSIHSLPPNDRVRIGEIIDEISEYSQLRILLLIDQSASMANKMEKLREAVYDFQLSIHSRAGISEVAIAFFPGESEFVDIVLPWTKESLKINQILSKLLPRGKTPTGPALLSSLNYMIPSYQLPYRALNNKRNLNGALDEFII